MFSKDLEVSIANLFDKAHEINIQYLTVEHLFLMILSDFDVKDFIESHDVRIEALKDELNEHLKKSSIMSYRKNLCFRCHGQCSSTNTKLFCFTWFHSSTFRKNSDPDSTS